MLEDGSEKMVQGVREIFEIFDSPDNSESQAAGKLVLIGRYLVDFDFPTSLKQTLGLAQSV